MWLRDMRPRFHDQNVFSVVHALIMHLFRAFRVMPRWHWRNHAPRRKSVVRIKVCDGRNVLVIQPILFWSNLVNLRTWHAENFHIPERCLLFYFANLCISCVSQIIKPFDIFVFDSALRPRKSVSARFELSSARPSHCLLCKSPSAGDGWQKTCSVINWKRRKLQINSAYCVFSRPARKFSYSTSRREF